MYGPGEQHPPADTSNLKATADNTEPHQPRFTASCRSGASCATLQRLDRIQHLACCGDWEYDLATGTVTWSRSVFQLLRRDMGNGMLTWEEFLHCYPAADAAKLQQAETLARNGLEQHQIQLWPRFGNGFPIQHQCTLIPLFTARGEVRSITGFLREMNTPAGTPLEARDRDRIRESGPGLHSTGSVQFRISIPEGTYEYISPSVYELTGLPPRDWYQQPLLLRELLFPGWRSRFERAFRRFVMGKASNQYTFPILHKQGEIRWLRLQVHAFHDRCGALIAVEGSAQDVTALKREESERRQLIRQLRKASADSSSRDGLIPICSHCKKVRDDQGLWKHLEHYLGKDGALLFSHGLCPNCLTEHYPQFCTPEPAEAPPAAETR